jgi:hypothetical protein
VPEGARPPPPLCHAWSRGDHRGVRSVALRLPGDRPVRAGHRVYVSLRREMVARLGVSSPGRWPPRKSSRWRSSPLKRCLRPMRGLKTDQSARIIIAGHAFIQNIRRGHYELGVDEPMTLRVVGTFDELALAIRPAQGSPISPASASPSATTPSRRVVDICCRWRSPSTTSHHQTRQCECCRLMFLVDFTPPDSYTTHGSSRLN